MNENTSGSGNLLDTTDCLEAVGVFRGWKNFFFIIIFLSILLLQACFWLSDLGMIPMPKEIAVGNLRIFYSKPGPASLPGSEEVNVSISDTNQPAQPADESPANEPNESIKTDEPNQASGEGAPVMLAAVTTVSSPNDVNGVSNSGKEKAGFLSGISFDQVVLIMRFTNAILILTSILYCFTMLFSLKISMLGRLGGINHITRAFFLSLLMLAMVIPWQRIFNGIIIGSVFTPEEFIRSHIEKSSDMLDIVLYYVRFCGYMAFAFLLLLLAQIRSSRWAKAILRRLEII